MSRRSYKILILCTGNSSRSIMGEYLLRKKGKGRFEVFSAGVNSRGNVNPFTLWVLAEHFGIDASDARSKPADEFKTAEFDCVITVCDNAREQCPVWPGKPIIAHWGSPDPAAAEGTEEQKKRAFLQVALQISRRVDLLCALPEETLLPEAIRKIGQEAKIAGDTPAPPQ